MTSKRWAHALGIVTAGVCLALGVGHGVAVAEPDAASPGSTSSTSPASDTVSAPSASPPKIEVLAPQHDSSGDAKAATKPTSTLSASTVKVERDPEPAKSEPAVAAESPPEPGAEPEAEPAVLPAAENVVVAVEMPDRGRSKPPESVSNVEPPTSPVRVGRVEQTNVERPVASATTSPPTESTPTESTPAAPAFEQLADTQVADPAPARALAPVVTATAVSTVAAPPQPNLINVVGTLLFRLITLPLRLLEQTPVVPPGYSVTVGKSTLDVGCGCGQSVGARWYFPDPAAHDGVAPQSIVYLQHGFIRSNSAMSAMAIEMAERTNSVVVTPTLTSNPFTADGCWINGEPMQRAVADLFVGDRTALQQSALDAGWTGGALPTRFVLAGHSAGGGLAAAAAGYTVDNGTASDLLLVVMLDGVPTGNVLPAALAKLSGANARQVLQIASPPYVWNANGIGADQLTAARPGEFVGVRLVGGSHVDYEGRSSDLLAKIACGVPRPENVLVAQDLAVGWINDAVAGRPIVAPAPLGSTVAITTAAGDARAVVLGGVPARELAGLPV